MTEEKDLDPDDPILRWPGPHEISAIGRLHLAGRPPKYIMGLLKMRGTKFAKSLEKARTDAITARRAGRPLHHALIKEDHE